MTTPNLIPNKPRHAELVSASIGPHLWSRRWQAEANREVAPLGVFRMDKVDLPRPVPAFQLLLAGDGGGHFAKEFVMNEAVDSITLGEAGRHTTTMLPQAGDEVGSDTNVERAVRFAGEDIGARVALVGHSSEPAAKWTLKQVQGDGGGMVALVRHSSEPAAKWTLKQVQGDDEGMVVRLRPCEEPNGFLGDEAVQLPGLLLDCFPRHKAGVAMTGVSGKAAEWTLKHVQGDEGGVWRDDAKTWHD